MARQHPGSGTDGDENMTMRKGYADLDAEDDVTGRTRAVTTPADDYYGRQRQILTQRQQLKLATIARRKALVTTPVAD